MEADLVETFKTITPEEWGDLALANLKLWIGGNEHLVKNFIRNLIVETDRKAYAIGLAEQQAKIDALGDALWQYGTHWSSCASRGNDNDIFCSCGFGKVRKLARGK